MNENLMKKIWKKNEHISLITQTKNTKFQQKQIDKKKT